MQLRAASSAADRANRPTPLILVPTLLLIAAAIFSLWSLRSFAGARSQLKSQAARSAEITGLLDTLAAVKAEEKDTGRQFQKAAYLLTDLDEGTPEEPGHAKRLGLNIRDVTDRRPPSPVRDEELVLRQVDCYISGQPLDKIFEWMNACLNDENYKGRLFVYQVNLKPNRVSGWDAEPVTFGIYETR
ncbi:MAG: hypothetical protein RIB32_03585 [Phycisphaerales bacterium]